MDSLRQFRFRPSSRPVDMSTIGALDLRQFVDMPPNLDQLKVLISSLSDASFGDVLQRCGAHKDGITELRHCLAASQLGLQFLLFSQGVLKKRFSALEAASHTNKVSHVTTTALESQNRELKAALEGLYAERVAGRNQIHDLEKQLRETEEMLKKESGMRMGMMANDVRYNNVVSNSNHPSRNHAMVAAHYGDPNVHNSHMLQAPSCCTHRHRHSRRHRSGRRHDDSSSTSSSSADGHRRKNDRRRDKRGSSRREDDRSNNNRSSHRNDGGSRVVFSGRAGDTLPQRDEGMQEVGRLVQRLMTKIETLEDQNNRLSTKLDTVQVEQENCYKHVLRASREAIEANNNNRSSAAAVTKDRHHQHNNNAGSSSYSRTVHVEDSLPSSQQHHHRYKSDGYDDEPTYIDRVRPRDPVDYPNNNNNRTQQYTPHNHKSIPTTTIRDDDRSDSNNNQNASHRSNVSSSVPPHQQPVVSMSLDEDALISASSRIRQQREMEYNDVDTSLRVSAATERLEDGLVSSGIHNHTSLPPPPPHRAVDNIEDVTMMAGMEEDEMEDDRQDTLLPQQLSFNGPDSAPPQAAPTSNTTTKNATISPTTQRKKNHYLQHMDGLVDSDDEESSEGRITYTNYNNTGKHNHSGGGSGVYHSAPIVADLGLPPRSPAESNISAKISNVSFGASNSKSAAPVTTAGVVKGSSSVIVTGGSTAFNEDDVGEKSNRDGGGPVPLTPQASDDASADPVDAAAAFLAGLKKKPSVVVLASQHKKGSPGGGPSPIESRKSSVTGLQDDEDAPPPKDKASPTSAIEDVKEDPVDAAAAFLAGLKRSHASSANKAVAAVPAVVDDDDDEGSLSLSNSMSDSLTTKRRKAAAAAASSQQPRRSSRASKRSPSSSSTSSSSSSTVSSNSSSSSRSKSISNKVTALSLESPRDGNNMSRDGFNDSQIFGGGIGSGGGNQSTLATPNKGSLVGLGMPTLTGAGMSNNSLNHSQTQIGLSGSGTAKRESSKLLQDSRNELARLLAEEAEEERMQEEAKLEKARTSLD